MNKRTLALLAALGIAGTACKDSTGVPDLNNISSETALAGGLTQTTLQLLATGVLNASRSELDGRYLVFTETMARDFYRLDNAESRYVTELIGSVTADYSAFTGGGAFSSMYITNRTANTLINNLPSATFLSAGQTSAVKGFAQTMKALALYRVLESRDTLGIAVDVNHDVNSAPAAFECKPNVLAEISALLDSANTNLLAGGSAFPFAVPSGFSGFDTPAAFAKFNRGLKGKVELYRALPQGNRTKATGTAGFNAAIAAINASFASPTAAMNLGPAYTYSTAPGDATNPLADANIYLNPFVGDSIQAGDKRASKIITLSTAKSLNSVTSKYKSTVTDPAGALTLAIPILTNSELLLLRAQAEIELGLFPAATADINAVHVADGGLTPYVAFADKPSAIKAVLYEKRYSLLGNSAHRLVDLRTYGLLNASAGPGRSTGDIFQSVLPIPKREFDTRNVTVLTPACP